MFFFVLTMVVLLIHSPLSFFDAVFLSCDTAPNPTDFVGPSLQNHQNIFDSRPRRSLLWPTRFAVLDGAGQDRSSQYQQRKQQGPADRHLRSRRFENVVKGGHSVQRLANCAQIPRARTQGRAHGTRMAVLAEMGKVLLSRVG